MFSSVVGYCAFIFIVVLFILTVIAECCQLYLKFKKRLNKKIDDCCFKYDNSNEPFRDDMERKLGRLGDKVMNYDLDQDDLLNRINELTKEVKSLKSDDEDTIKVSPKSYHGLVHDLNGTYQHWFAQQKKMRE